MKRNPAQRRYIRRFIPMMLGYVVLLFAANSLMEAWHPDGALLAVLAVLPALPLIGVIVVMGLYLIEEKDEFLRQRLVIAMLGGLGGLLAVATIWGFLQLFHVVVPAPLFLAFPTWCALFGLTTGVLSLLDRRGRGT